VLKNQGYHFEHNYGHGYQHLSVVFAVLMMLACLVDQTQQLCCPLFQAVWTKLGNKWLLWVKLKALFYDYALESMRYLCEALLYGLKKSAPTLAIDSSSIGSRLGPWLRHDDNRSFARSRTERCLNDALNLLGTESGTLPIARVA
jgi:hypothetical protein